LQEIDKKLIIKNKKSYGVGTTDLPENLIASAALSGLISNAKGRSHHQNF
jgi:hypothetical protein